MSNASTAIVILINKKTNVMNKLIMMNSFYKREINQVYSLIKPKPTVYSHNEQTENVSKISKRDWKS